MAAAGRLLAIENLFDQESARCFDRIETFRRQLEATASATTIK
jgi:hypothetical protein